MRERINLQTKEDELKALIKRKLNKKEITAQNYSTLTQEEKEIVNEILFESHAEKINVYQSLAAIEYILFSYMRVNNQKSQGLSLSQEDKKIENSLNAITNMHPITDRDIYLSDWENDYLAYAQHQVLDVLDNREQYYKLKKERDGE